MKSFNLVKTGLAGIVLSLVGCASIPPEAPELSVQLGQRISAIEDANITLLHRYFDEKRKDVDRFIEDEWVPVFADEFFSNTKISNVWDTIVRENNKKDRLLFLIKTGPKLQARINRKRVELVAPLDDLERRIEQKLRDEYAQARAINNSLTSFLLSAAKVAENRERYLAMAGVTDQKIGKIIDATDDAISDLLETTGDVQERITAAEKYLEKLRAIREKI